MALVIVFSLSRGGGRKKMSDTIEDFVWAFEASGLLAIIKPSSITPTHVFFKYGGEEYSPKHGHPFTPVGRPERIFPWAVGSDRCLDPLEAHGMKDVDDPEPLIEEAKHWFRSIRAAIGALGFSLKQNWFLILIMGMGFVAVGYIVGNAYPLH